MTSCLYLSQPMRLGAELLLSLMLVPLTLSVALSRDLLQLTVSWLVTSFPSLEPAAKGTKVSSPSVSNQLREIRSFLGLNQVLNAPNFLGLKPGTIPTHKGYAVTTRRDRLYIKTGGQTSKTNEVDRD